MSCLTTPRIILLLGLLTCCIATPQSNTATNTTISGRFTKIYAFGDSFTDTGNTQSATGPYAFGHVSSAPYGSTFFHHSTNRYSDGRLVVDFLASTLSLPFLQPYLKQNSDFSHGVNFAVAGSTALDHDFFVKNNITIDITPQSLTTQRLWFEQYFQKQGCIQKGSPECERLLKDALFWVGEIGVNDYAYSVLSTVSRDLIRQLALKNIYNFLQVLLNKGAKYVVVQGLPQIGCLPMTKVLSLPDDKDDIGCVRSVNQFTIKHNQLLQQNLEELKKKYPDAVILYADYYMAHHTVMKNTTGYGFTEPFKVCCGTGEGDYNFDIFSTCGSPDVSKACGNPSRFVNWDGVHLTEAMYKIIADKFFRRGFCRPSFEELLETKKKRS